MKPASMKKVVAGGSGSEQLEHKWEKLPEKPLHKIFGYLTTDDLNLHLRLVCKAWKVSFDHMIERPDFPNGSRYEVALLREREVNDYLESRVGYYDLPSPGRRFYFCQSHWRDEYWSSVKKLVEEYGEEIWTVRLNCGMEEDGIDYRDMYEQNLEHILEILKGLPNLKALILEDHHLSLSDQVEVFDFTRNYLKYKRFPRWNSLTTFQADPKIPPALMNKVLKYNGQVIETLTLSEGQLKESLSLPNLESLELKISKVEDLEEFSKLKTSVETLTVTTRSTGTSELASVLHRLLHFAPSVKKLTLYMSCTATTKASRYATINFPELKTLVVAEFTGETLSELPKLTKLRSLEVRSWDPLTADKIREELRSNQHGVWEKFPCLHTIRHVGMKEDEKGRRTLVTTAVRGYGVKIINKFTLECIGTYE